jgi:hypothetical protein
MVDGHDIHRDWSVIGIHSVKINTGALGSAANADLVALAAGKKIRVHALYIVGNASGSVFQLRSGTTAISGVQWVIQGTPHVLPYSEVPWCETVAGEALNLLNGAVSTTYSGFLIYSLVD